MTAISLTKLRVWFHVLHEILNLHLCGVFTFWCTIMSAFHDPLSHRYIKSTGIERAFDPPNACSSVSIGWWLFPYVTWAPLDKSTSYLPWFYHNMYKIRTCLVSSGIPPILCTLSLHYLSSSPAFRNVSMSIMHTGAALVLWILQAVVRFGGPYYHHFYYPGFIVHSRGT